MKKNSVFILTLAVLCVSGTLPAAGIVNTQIFDKEILATIDVGGLFSGNLRIMFEEVVGLNSSALDIDALEVDPTDPQLLARFPDPTAINVPGLFPVLVQINPSAASSLTLTGVVNIELSTTNLGFDPSFRLFTSHAGGVFQDITNFSGVGSYRVRGTTGQFSDFLILLDLRSTASVVDLKFANLDSSLHDNESLIESQLFSTLESLLDSALAEYQAGRPLEAVADVEAMANLVWENEGTRVPNVYRANDPQTVNVAGNLRSQAATLVFSLKQLP